jgi:hypothetical protein
VNETNGLPTPLTELLIDRAFKLQPVACARALEPVEAGETARLLTARSVTLAAEVLIRMNPDDAVRTLI